MRADTFRDFETWEGLSGQPKKVGASTWSDDLVEKKLIRPSGIFLSSRDREAVLAACRDCLNANGAVDLQDEGTVAQLN